MTETGPRTVCVFTPTYERAYILPVLYESLVAQTFHDFVWMIVDDGSTDNTWEVMTELAGRDSRVRILRQVNAGKGAALNNGIRV